MWASFSSIQEIAQQKLTEAKEQALVIARDVAKDFQDEDDSEGEDEVSPSESLPAASISTASSSSTESGDKLSTMTIERDGYKKEVKRLREALLDAEEQSVLGVSKLQKTIKEKNEELKIARAEILKLQASATPSSPSKAANEQTDDAESRTKIIELSSELKLVKEDVVEYESIMATLKEQKLTAETQKNDLQKELDLTKDLLKTAQAATAMSPAAAQVSVDVESKISELQKELIAAKEAFDAAQETHEKTMQEIQLEQIEETESLNKQLEKKEEELATVMEDCKSMAQQLEDSEAELAAVGRRMEQTELQVAASNQKAASLAEQLDSASSACVQKDAIIEEHKLAVAAAENTLAAVQAEYQAAAKRFADREAALVSETAQEKESSSKLKVKLLDNDALLKGLQDERDKAVNQVESLRSELAEAARHTAALHQQVVDLQSAGSNAATKIEELTSQFESAKEASKASQAELRREQANKEDLAQQLNKCVEQMEQMGKEGGGAESALVEASAEVAKLRQELTEAAAKLAKADAAEQSKDESLAAAADTERQLRESLDAKFAEFRDQEEKWKVQLQDLQQAVERSKSEAEQSRAEVEQGRVNLAELQAELERSTSEADRSQKAATETETEMVELTAKLEAMSEAARVATSREEKLRAISEKQSQEFKTELEKSRMDVEQCTAEAEQSKAETERSRAEAEQSKAETERSRAEAEQSKAEAERSRAEAEQSKAETAQSKAQAEQRKAEAEESITLLNDASALKATSAALNTISKLLGKEGDSEERDMTAVVVEQVETLVEQIERSKNVCRKLEEEKELLSQQQEQQQKQLATADEQYENTIAQLRRLQAECRAAFAAEEEARTESARFQAELSRSKKEQGELQQQLAVITERVNSSHQQGQAEQMEQAQQLSELKTEMNDMNKLVSRLQGDVEARVAEKLELQSNHSAEMAVAKQQLTAALLEADRLRSHLRDAAEGNREAEEERDRQFEELEQELRQHKLDGEAMKTLADEYADLQRDYDLKEQECQTHATALANMEGVIEQFQNDHSNYKQQMEAKVAELLETAAQSKALSSKLKQVEKELAQAEKISSSTAEQLGHTQQYVLKLEEENAQLRTSFQQTVSRLKAFSQQDSMIDRRIVVKMLVTYFERDDKDDVMQVMYSLLQFTPEERRKVEESRNAGLTTLSKLAGLFNPFDGVKEVTASQLEDGNLADLWVDFLLKESDAQDVLIRPDKIFSQMQQQVAQHNKQQQEYEAKQKEFRAQQKRLRGEEPSPAASPQNTVIRHDSWQQGKAQQDIQLRMAQPVQPLQQQVQQQQPQQLQPVYSPPATGDLAQPASMQQQQTQLQQRQQAEFLRGQQYLMQIQQQQLSDQQTQQTQQHPSS